MRLLRILPVTIVVAFLAACGTSSVTDVTSLSHTMPPPGERVGAPKEPIQVTDPDAKAQLRKVATKALNANKPGASGYKIGPQDVLQISVFKVEELSKTVQVSETGTINYPLIGETDVSGKTARELEQDLTQRLGSKYLQNPQLTVFISQYNSQRVTIEGAIKKPGIYPLQGRMTLLQLVASAQGLDDAAEDDVVILRKNNGKQSAARFAVSEIRAGNGKDPQLNAGDVVIVNTSFTKQAFNNVLKALPLARAFVLF